MDVSVSIGRKLLHAAFRNLIDLGVAQGEPHMHDRIEGMDLCDLPGSMMRLSPAMMCTISYSGLRTLRTD